MLPPPLSEAQFLSLSSSGQHSSAEVETVGRLLFYTTKPAGMRMGLAIVRSIIEAHGGVVWALNNPTGGATFHVAIPVRHVAT